MLWLQLIQTVLIYCSVTYLLQTLERFEEMVIWCSEILSSGIPFLTFTMKEENSFGNIPSMLTSLYFRSKVLKSTLLAEIVDYLIS